MKSVAMVAFTGGLDSTWCLYDVLRKNKFTEVYVVNANVGACISQTLLELFARRCILNELKTLFPNKVIKEITCPTPTMYVVQGTRRTQLVQPINIYAAFLRSTALLGGTINIVSCITGWHREDVFENNPNEGVVEKWLGQYRDIINTMCVSINPEANNTVILQTPAWDKHKLDMWNDLPTIIQQHITTAQKSLIDWDDDTNTVSISISDYKKIEEYSELGIHITPDRHYDLSVLTDLDLWAIHVNTLNGVIPTFMGHQTSVLFYLGDRVKERLGKAVTICQSSPYSFFGFLCMSDKTLEAHVNECNSHSERGTYYEPDNYDDLFNGTHKNEYTGKIDI